MKWLRRFCLWLADNRLGHRTRQLQADQMDEHRNIVTEIRARKERNLRDLADVIMRLEAVTDQLEQRHDRDGR